MAEEQLVLFSLGNEEYAISITQVKEIVQYEGTTKVPGTPEYMEGIINLRGKVLPLIDLAKRLALTAGKNSNRRALVIETAGREIGIVVDEVTEVIRLRDSAIAPLPATTKKRYLRGIGKEEKRLLILLDVDELFSEEEMQELKKVG